MVGDAARLRQVLLNLAGNAIKFTSTGGVALIVEPGIWPNEISFLVRDTGIGIAPEAQQRIFREFEQADERIARSYGGTGLGLSISERIVKRMGGRITLESQPGAGSTFEVSIPLAAAGSGSDARTFAAPDLTGQSIMLVAPQSIEASLIARRLQRWGGQTCMRLGYRGGAGAAAGADLARGAARSRPRREQTCSRWARPRAACDAAHRAVHAGDAARTAACCDQSAFTGYLVKPLRAASLAARLTMAPEVPAPDLAGDAADRCARRCRSAADRAGARPFDSGRRRQRDQRAADAFAADAARPSAVITTNGEEALESWLAAEVRRRAL